MVMHAVDQHLIARLLQDHSAGDSSNNGSSGTSAGGEGEEEPKSPSGGEVRKTFIRFLQEGVVLRADPFDDKRNYPGTLILVSEVPNIDEDPDELSSNPLNTYLLWVPSQFLLVLAPHLVSPAAKAAFERQASSSASAGGSAADLTSPKTPASSNASYSAGSGAGNLVDPSKMRVEYMYTICSNVILYSKMQRRTNLRGKRIVILTKHEPAGEQECPLIFNDGGMTKLVDELKKMSLLRQNPSAADEYLFPPPPANLAEVISSSTAATGKAVAKHRDPTVDSSGADDTPVSTTSKGMTPNSPPPQTEDDFKKSLYDSSGEAVDGSKKHRSAKETTKKAISSIMNFGQRMHDKGAKIAEAIAGPTAINGNQGEGYDPLGRESTDGSFEEVVALEDVENLIPELTSLKKEGKKMGPPLTAQEWLDCFDAEGRMVQELFTRAKLKVFSGGIEEDKVHRVGSSDQEAVYSLRGEVWSYLLEVYYPSQSYLEREAAKAEWSKEYATYKMQWSTISEAQAKNWEGFRVHRTSIEKDVSRTDRTHPAFEQDDSPKLKQLYDILMSFAMYNFDLGYCQGMSDMCAMFLLLFDDEVEAFVMFRAMISKKCQGNFGSDVLKGGMAKSLKAVDVLTRAFVPTLHGHLEKNHATDFSFVFRWLLLLYKREFPIPQVFVLWDALLSSPHTEQYELFVTVAILRNLTSQILEQCLTYDEMLKFTCNVAMRMDVVDVLLLTEEFYEFVTQQMAWKKRTVVVSGGGSLAKPSLAEILETMAPSDTGAGSPSSAAASSPRF